MLASPDLPDRQTFSAIRRAFDDVFAILETDEDLPVSILDLVSTAQRRFWELARRAVSGGESADGAANADEEGAERMASEGS